MTERTSPDGSDFEAKPVDATDFDGEVVQGEVVSSVESAEEVKSPERTADELQAHEILTGFEMYKTDVKEGAAEFVTSAQRKVAQAKNLASTPKAMYLEMKRDKAQEKYDRKSAKQDQSSFDFVNRRRDRKAAEAYDKLNVRQDKLDQHKDKMAGRLEAVDKAGTERLDAIEAHRQELMQNKIDATERKITRQEQREQRNALKSEKLTHEEREEKVKAFIEGRKKQIRAAAIKAIQRDVALGDINYGLT